MKVRYFAVLMLGLLTMAAQADDPDSGETVDTDSLWITSLAPAGAEHFVAGKATGLLLRPGAVVRFPAGNPAAMEELYKHPAAVWTVDATADGKRIVSADYRGNLVVYETESKEATTHESAFERWCQTILLSPDDQSVLAGNESGKLFVWDLAAGEVSKSLELAKASITSLAFAPNQKQLAATDGEGKVHLLSWPELKTVGTIAVGEETAWCVAYENDNRLLVGSADQNLYRVAAKADAKPESIAKGTDWITRLAVSGDGQIAASEVSGAVHLVSGGNVTTINAESGVWSLCFGQPGQLLVGTRKDGILAASQSWTWQALPEPGEGQADEAGESEENDESESDEETEE